MSLFSLYSKQWKKGLGLVCLLYIILSAGDVFANSADESSSDPKVTDTGTGTGTTSTTYQWQDEWPPPSWLPPERDSLPPPPSPPSGGPLADPPPSSGGTRGSGGGDKGIGSSGTSTLQGQGGGATSTQVRYPDGRDVRTVTYPGTGTLTVTFHPNSDGRGEYTFTTPEGSTETHIRHPDRSHTYIDRKGRIIKWNAGDPAPSNVPPFLQ